jgi:hypothetical protein
MVEMAQESEQWVVSRILFVWLGGTAAVQQPTLAPLPFYLLTAS